MPSPNVFTNLGAAIGLPFSPAMKVVFILALAAGALLGQTLTPVSASADEEQTADLNVNSRYTIESINFVDQREYRLSTSALDEIKRLVGAKVSTEALDRLALRLRGDLRAHDVTFKLARGAQPESVRVLIQVDRAGGSFDASVPNLSYNSALGFTGTGQLMSTIGPNAFTFRMLRDSDNLIERFSGVQAKYERSLSESGRIRLGFEFDAYQDQYANSTLTALANNSQPSSLWRRRLWFPSEL